MSAERRNGEFQQIQEMAVQILRNPERLIADKKLSFLARRDRELLIFEFPAFEDYRSWAFIRKLGQFRDPARYFIQVQTWNRLHDAERLLQPMIGLANGFHLEPTLEIKEVEITEGFRAEILQSLKQVTIPIYRAGGIGIDGVVRGIEIKQPEVSLSWWMDGPEDWFALNKWFEDTLRKLAEL